MPARRRAEALGRHGLARARHHPRRAILHLLLALRGGRDRAPSAAQGQRRCDRALRYIIDIYPCMTEIYLHSLCAHGRAVSGTSQLNVSYRMPQRIYLSATCSMYICLYCARTTPGTLTSDFLVECRCAHVHGLNPSVVTQMYGGANRQDAHQHRTPCVPGRGITLASSAGRCDCLRLLLLRSIGQL